MPDAAADARKATAAAISSGCRKRCSSDVRSFSVK